MNRPGTTLDQHLDAPRLARQRERVLNLMLDRDWMTLREIEDGTGDPQGSISARLRCLRAEGFEVLSRRRNGAGTWEYRVRVQVSDGCQLRLIP